MYDIRGIKGEFPIAKAQQQKAISRNPLIPVSKPEMEDVQMFFQDPPSLGWKMFSQYSLRGIFLLYLFGGDDHIWIMHAKWWCQRKIRISSMFKRYDATICWRFRQHLAIKNSLKIFSSKLTLLINNLEHHCKYKALSVPDNGDSSMLLWIASNKSF